MSLSIVALPREIIFFALFALIFSRCIAVKFTSLSNHQTMPSNTAAWLQEKGPLEVKSAPYSPPQDNEIVVKNCAVAINPVDWMKQEMGNIIFSHVKYPFVMGNDTAGEVVEVGTGVTRFKVGDRVVGHAVGMDPKVNRSAEGAFQTYTVLRAHMTSPIPSTLSYENAAVIPLGLSTAACGLFEKDQLALPYRSRTPGQNSRWRNVNRSWCSRCLLGHPWEVQWRQSPHHGQLSDARNSTKALCCPGHSVPLSLWNGLDLVQVKSKAYTHWVHLRQYSCLQWSWQGHL
jgi:hypothetical protein